MNHKSEDCSCDRNLRELWRQDIPVPSTETPPESPTACLWVEDSGLVILFGLEITFQLSFLLCVQREKPEQNSHPMALVRIGQQEAQTGQ